MTGDDASQIQTTLLRYATAIDTKDWELFRTVFTDDCRMEAGNQGILVGCEKVADHMERLHAPLDASLHRLSNFTIEVTGDTARATTYLDALLVRRDHPDGPTFRVAGHYDDVLQRTRDEWRIAGRQFSPIWREGNIKLIAPE